MSAKEICKKIQQANCQHCRMIATRWERQLKKLVGDDWQEVYNTFVVKREFNRRKQWKSLK